MQEAANIEQLRQQRALSALSTLEEKSISQLTYEIQYYMHEREQIYEKTN